MPIIFMNLLQIAYIHWEMTTEKKHAHTERQSETVYLNLPTDSDGEKAKSM